MTGATSWQKSSYSGADDNQDCVEIAAHPTGVLIRESDEPRVTARTSRAPFAALITGVKAGRFDR
ncbi:DUF397 domain-containing protein [Streptomyces olivoreticuli]|uniref:DUF397 domain-containing protein n=1 Tax=Streptomyces olivoreticuli TaxID=68246 RepID=UPI00265A5A5E|nr:DUF397 domain-containing protein [Streptomyces olivoreticuli]WKK27593.1 DUF397 domain-containing protein [Streptomyces olivoreticuli]